MRKLGKIGVYGKKTRRLQRKLSFEAYGLTFKTAEVFRYLGSKENAIPNIDDIETTVFGEVPDRAYDSHPISIPVGYQREDEAKMDFSRMGLINPLQDETLFRFHVDDFTVLGRMMIVGDAFEIPFMSPKGKRTLWEVVDVDDKSVEEKFLVIVHAVPIGKNRTTRDLPIDHGAGGIMDGLMGNFDMEVADQVPSESLSFDPIEEPEDVDYRDPLQSDFLDDPSKEF